MAHNDLECKDKNTSFKNTWKMAWRFLNVIGVSNNNNSSTNNNKNNRRLIRTKMIIQQ